MARKEGRNDVRIRPGKGKKPAGKIGNVGEKKVLVNFLNGKMHQNEKVDGRSEAPLMMQTRHKESESVCRV